MSFLKSKVFLILEIALIIATTVGFIQVIQKKEKIEIEIADLQKERDRELAKREQLNKREKVIGSDSYVELEAKRTLGYRKEGETVVVFYEDEAYDAAGPSDPVVSQESQINPVGWLRYFFPYK